MNMGKDRAKEKGGETEVNGKNHSQEKLKQIIGAMGQNERREVHRGTRPGPVNNNPRKTNDKEATLTRACRARSPQDHHESEAGMPAKELNSRTQLSGRNIALQ